MTPTTRSCPSGPAYDGTQVGNAWRDLQCAPSQPTWFWTILILEPPPGQVEITCPWCAEYVGDGRNCGFSTYDQCPAKIGGNSGYCIEDPMYRPTADARGERWSLRHSVRSPAIKSIHPAPPGLIYAGAAGGPGWPK